MGGHISFNKSLKKRFQGLRKKPPTTQARPTGNDILTQLHANPRRIRYPLSNVEVQHLLGLREHYRPDPGMDTSSEDSDDAVNYERAALKQLRSKDPATRPPSHVLSAAIQAASTVLKSSPNVSKSRGVQASNVSIDKAHEPLRQNLKDN